MKRFLVLLFCILSIGRVFSQVQLEPFQLSESAEVSILTGTPGEQLFEAFGHTALRVVDPKLKLDWIYNFGTFNFSQENFYLNFVQGYLLYYLSVRDFDYVYEGAMRNGKQIREQVLNLTQSEKQQIFTALEVNRQEKNKYYYYDYFYDNCATRYRDLLRNVLHDKLIEKDPIPDSTYTIRQLMHKYLDKHEWGSFGIDLALAVKIDQPSNINEAMYLPDYFELALSSFSIQRDSVTVVPLVKEQHMLIEPPILSEPQKANMGPAAAGWILFVFCALWSFVNWKGKSKGTAIDIVLFLTFGLFGSGLLYLWLFTNHITTASNYNIIWASPLYLLFVFQLFKDNRPAYVRYFFLLNSIVLSILMFTWGWIPQDLHYSLVPVVFTLLIRSLLIFVYRPKTVNRYKY